MANREKRKTLTFSIDQKMNILPLDPVNFEARKNIILKDFENWLKSIKENFNLSDSSIVSINWSCQLQEEIKPEDRAIQTGLFDALLDDIGKTAPPSTDAFERLEKPKHNRISMTLDKKEDRPQEPKPAPAILIQTPQGPPQADAPKEPAQTESVKKGAAKKASKKPPSGRKKVQVEEIDVSPDKKLRVIAAENAVASGLFDALVPGPEEPPAREPPAQPASRKISYRPVPNLHLPVSKPAEPPAIRSSNATMVTQPTQMESSPPVRSKSTGSLFKVLTEEEKELLTEIKSVLGPEAEQLTDQELLDNYHSLPSARVREFLSPRTDQASSKEDLDDLANTIIAENAMTEEELIGLGYMTAREVVNKRTITDQIQSFDEPLSTARLLDLIRLDVTESDGFGSLVSNPRFDSDKIDAARLLDSLPSMSREDLLDLPQSERSFVTAIALESARKREVPLQNEDEMKVFEAALTDNDAFLSLLDSTLNDFQTVYSADLTDEVNKEVYKKVKRKREKKIVEEGWTCIICHTKNEETDEKCSKCQNPSLPLTFPQIPPRVGPFGGGNADAYKEWLRSYLKFDTWQNGFLEYKKALIESPSDCNNIISKLRAALSELNLPDKSLQDFLAEYQKNQINEAEVQQDETQETDSEGSYIDEEPENVSNRIHKPSLEIPEGFPPAPPRPAANPPALTQSQNSKESYKAWMKKKMRYESWYNALQAYRLREAEGKASICHNIIEALRAELSQAQPESTKKKPNISNLNVKLVDEFIDLHKKSEYDSALQSDQPPQNIKLYSIPKQKSPFLVSSEEVQASPPNEKKMDRKISSIVLPRITSKMSLPSMEDNRKGSTRRRIADEEEVTTVAPRLTKSRSVKSMPKKLSLNKIPTLKK
eukprot:TRINITY_DN4321_c0_g1_i1.p1 TRINITY_DN4321_c0_g1~~TRINITY_DN4321_c0_g1_i1.p1  ORF type:complete len:883 (-),score=257.47 TRINITY_DN4321_c0_g1_i1:80-2728(-)